jgi:hypothetical protein
MAEAQALNATFFAFRKREQGGVLLGAGIAFAVGMIVLVAALLAVAWAILGQDFFSSLQHMGQMGGKSSAPSPGTLPPNFGRIFLLMPLGLIWSLLIFVLLASFESACLRWMIRGERSGPLNLCFGADMWRVYGTYWAWFLYFFCTYILFWIVLLVLAFAGAAAGGKDSALATGLMVFGVVVAWVVGWIYVAVRLAPAAATSIGVGHFAPLKAWTVTRGRFWALFGSYLLLGLLYIVVAMIIGGVIMGSLFASILAHVDWTAIQSDPQSVARAYRQALLDIFANPLSMALYVGGQVAIRAVGIVFYILFYGVNARAVQAALEEGKISYEPAAA